MLHFRRELATREKRRGNVGKVKSDESDTERRRKTTFIRNRQRTANHIRGGSTVATILGITVVRENDDRQAG